MTALADDDLVRAMDLARAATGNDADAVALYDAAQARAAGLVATPGFRRMVDVVAAELLRRGHLTGDDINELLEAEHGPDDDS